MSGALRELIAKFGIEVDDHELKKGHEEVEGFKETLKVAGELLAEVFAIHEIHEFIASTVEAGEQLHTTAAQLGTTTEELQALELAAGSAGVANEALSTGLRFLNRNIAEAADGGNEVASVFHALKIAVKGTDGSLRSSSDVVEELADRIAEMPEPARATRVAMQLLGRGGAELIPLLRQGGGAFKDARKELEELGGGMREDFVVSAKKVGDEQKKLHIAWMGFKSDVVGAILPGVLKVVEFFKKLTSSARDVVQHTHLIRDALAGVAGIGAAVAIYKIASALKALAAGELAVSLPLLLIAAGVAALYLAFNELEVTLDGGDSVLTEMLDHFGGLGAKQSVIESLQRTLENLGEAGRSVWEVVREVGDALGISFGDSPRGLLIELTNELQSFVSLLEAGSRNARAMAEAFGALTHGDWKGALDALKNSTVGHELEQGPSKGVSSYARGWAGKLAPASGLGGGGPAAASATEPFPGSSAFMGPALVISHAYTPSVPAGTMHERNITFHQTINQEIHGADAKAAADQSTRAVATETERALDRSRTAARRP